MRSADSDNKVRKFIIVSIEAHPTKRRSCHKTKEVRCQVVSDCSYVLIQGLYWTTTVHLLQDLLASLKILGRLQRYYGCQERRGWIESQGTREKTKTDRRNSRCFLDVSWDKNSLIGSVTAACFWAPDGSRRERKEWANERAGMLVATAATNLNTASEL